MERRKLIAVVGGLALLGGAIVVLRNETAPPEPQGFERYLDPRVQHVPDTQLLLQPTDLELGALDPTSLRARWQSAGGIGYGGFEVRWHDQTRLVRATETELTGLDPNAETTVEVRAVDVDGRRSEPAVAKASPRDKHDDGWAKDLVQPIDVFDGPEALNPRRWRVLDGGNTDCLGLRPLNGKRLEVTCDRLDLQSNVPLRSGVPDADGATGRVFVTTDGPTNLRDGDSELVVALLPEPFQDSGPLVPPYPQGAVVLHVTPFGARIEVGPGVPPTGKVVPVDGVSPLSTPGVRHRWELRVTPDAVLAVRDGDSVMASASIAVPWTVAWPRLAFRNARHTQVDSFALAGAPESPVPASVVPLGPSTQENGEAVLGNVPGQLLSGGSSVRVVAAVVAQRPTPVTVHFGDRSAPAAFMAPQAGIDEFKAAVVYADFPLPENNPAPRVRLSAADPAAGLTAYDAHLVVADGQATAQRPLPRLTDRAPRQPRVPRPALTIVHDSGEADRFPRGKVTLVAEFDHDADREVAAIKGLEVDLDGQRVAAVPTGGSAGGRHEFVVDLAEVPSGGHRFTVRVLPVDEGREVRSAEQAFELRPL